MPDMEDIIPAAYGKSLETAEAWVVFVRSDFPIGLRYGPFTVRQAGKLIEEMLNRNVKGSIMLNCGPEIDWEVVADFCPTVPVKEGKDEQAP